ncbi:MAG: chemotaxis protein CheW [Bryobacterales bacterium]|nr:chemotaxis protein CheW [Bryobacterales bacterium]
MEDREIINEFLIESNENLARLDQEMVELEARPKDAALLASIFRTIHTIKGTCGFLGFSGLERITHLGENLLSQLRNGERELNPGLVSLILEMVDVVKSELSAIESNGAESGSSHETLMNRLREAADAQSAPVPEAEPAARPPVAAPPPASIAAPPPPPAVAAQPAPETPPEAEAMTKSTIADATIRVDVGLLDRLMNLVGELVLARNQILQFGGRLEDASFGATSQRLNLITTQLQESVMKTRMQPIGVVWNKFPRVVRDLSAACGKQIQLDMEGAETELDKSIIEAIKDPLTHIVRNCCDHGIETPDMRLRAGKAAQGTLSLRAFHEGGQVNIEISDNGRGIDPVKLKQKALQKGLIRPEQAERMSEREAVSLIFRPGFSTAETVTNISGRGVGMDVVKTNIEKTGGTVDISSRPGFGTTVKIKIPLTLAIIPGLVVMSGGERFVIPQVSLLELVRLEGEAGKRQIERIQSTPLYRRRGNLLPIAYLNDVLRIGAKHRESDVINIVILQAEDRQFGLVVDGIHDTQEIVVKPLGKQLKSITHYAGATIMGDGKVALILDVPGLAARSGVFTDARDSQRSIAATGETAASERQSLLLFRSGRFERLAVPLSLVARLEEFPRARIERASGQSVVQYRDQILPLIPLAPYLEPGAASAADEVDPAQVVVFSNGERRLGLLVDEIVDIVEENVTARQKTDRPGLLGSAVVGDRVTDFLDLHSVIDQFGTNWFGSRGGAAGTRCTVLLADNSQFARGLVRNALEIAGFAIVEAASVNEALERLPRQRVSVVAAAFDLAGGGATALAEQLQSTPGLEHVPVVALSNDPGEPGFLGARERFADALAKFDRDAMLRSLLRLAARVGESLAPAEDIPTGVRS